VRAWMIMRRDGLLYSRPGGERRAIICLADEMDILLQAWRENRAMV